MNRVLSLTKQKKYETRVANKIRSDIEQLAELCRKEAIPSKVKVTTGNPFVEIIRLVQKENYDLVVVSAYKKRGSIKERFLGTTTHHLLRKCPCPIWVMHPPKKRYPRILAAINPTTEKEEQALNTQIIQLATSLTRREKGELHIFHAWDILYGESLLVGRGGMSPKKSINLLKILEM